MIEKINALGLDFGIWIEPEMVNPNSDLYRQHPDWCSIIRTVPGMKLRNQLMLNLAREDVYQYLYSCFSTLLRENNIKFIKWDMNRGVTEPGFLSAPTDEQRPFVLNTSRTCTVCLKHCVRNFRKYGLKTVPEVAVGSTWV